ncbi:MAG: aminotransferase class I/II-fold pyridoxal phosphate-dependent enzyme [Candidatus Bathyarchaeota archaeon]|nr:aminotransferase class I/II-fold pyridoxal phosphate-dependent enzyme [Candidatus Bathyarchaeota archaeon]
MINQDLTPSMFIGLREKGLISFGSGQPDLPPPPNIKKAYSRFKVFKYGLIQGELKLREALAKEYPRSSPENFVITNGASEALDLTLRAISLANNNKKNRVLLPRPYYYTYPRLVKLAGMEPVFTDLVDGRINFKDFEEKVVDCKAVLINSPSNPTGRVESMTTLKKIEKLTSDLGVYVISDEVYKDLIYVRENYLIKGPHVITVNSFSKTYALCGLRIGYLWSLDQDIVKRVVEIKNSTSMNTNILAQEMAFEALKAPKGFVEKQVEVFKKRRNLIYNRLKDMGLELWRPEGAFYVFPKIKKSKEFVWNMFKKYKVITYPGEWFGTENHVRFSYALGVEEIEKGLERVEKYLKNEGKIHLE